MRSWNSSTANSSRLPALHSTLVSPEMTGSAWGEAQGFWQSPILEPRKNANAIVAPKSFCYGPHDCQELFSRQAQSSWQQAIAQISFITLRCRALPDSTNTLRLPFKK